MYNTKSFKSLLNASRASTVSRGFTIIELLIVIVIIGILVAITAVSYNGITKSAKEATAKSDLKQASTQLEIDRTKSSNNQHPNTTSGLKSSPDTILEITSTGSTYCLSAIIPSSISFHITNTNTAPQSGTCSGHLQPDAPAELVNNTPIQNVNKLQCNALPVYTGSNPSAIRTLADNRDGTTRNYEIAKLADNKCWMLTNLKLGKTSGTTILTPANTNIASNFTLPQVGGNNTTDYDNPRVYGPVTGDTGSGATNYGYLYNWPAATAGESQTSMPASSGTAPYSICPKNWRLPVGGAYDSGIGEFADLDRAFGGTGKHQNGSPSVSMWNITGPFKGVLSGHWYGMFNSQANWGNFWSSSANPDNANHTFAAGFGPGSVNPANKDSRNYGFAVRCSLN